jgi:hypothetical protein
MYEFKGLAYYIRLVFLIVTSQVIRGNCAQEMGYVDIGTKVRPKYSIIARH